MRFWDGGGPLTWIGVMLLLATVASVRSHAGRWGRLGVPDAMVAGFLGLLLGPSILGWLPLQQELLEQIVYHGLALIFITVALRTPSRSDDTASGVRGVAFALPLLIAVQALVGMAVVAMWSVAVETLHPGVGLMVPLGFSQGPGQALALGSAWEATGMQDGAQLGLILAAAGFVCCATMGPTLLALGRWMGWRVEAERPEAFEPVVEVEPSRATGGLEPLTRQVAVVSVVYFGVWALIQGIVAAIGDHPEAVATVYGFHFVLAGLLALATRKVLGRLGRGDVLDTPLLSRLAALVVDGVTVSAIAAVQLEVVLRWWGVVLVLAVTAGATTAAICVWVARRAFAERPFDYALVLFGTATGTLATGLALLRVIDPELKGPVASGAVLGAAASVPASIPLVLMLQVPVSGWPSTAPTALGLTAAGMVLYGGMLVVLWVRWGHLRWLRPLHRFWPPPVPAHEG